MEVMNKLKVGIIGIGRIGRIHLENLTRSFDDVTVEAAADVSSEGRKYAESRGVPEIFEDADKVLSHPDLDAVVICSSTDTHATYVIRAAEEGKAIFCEKPLDLSVATLLEVLEVVKKNDVPLMVAFNRRFDANFRKVHHMVRSGKLGEPHILKITSRDPAPPPIDYIKVSGACFST